MRGEGVRASSLLEATNPKGIQAQESTGVLLNLTVSRNIFGLSKGVKP